MMSPEQQMQRCLELARQGQGKTHPNPMVGCVVLDASGQVVGEGFHAQYGGPHAEVMALDAAGERARGGTLFVSLEPCSHTGKTPPCTDKVLASGVKAVYCGMTDPNPKVAGTGIDTLRHHGLTVHTDILKDACQKLNEAFCHFIRTRRPFVVVKQAMTLDGRIATRNGHSQWITGPEARRWVHALRAQSDGILTTAETVLKDDSKLTVRDAPLLGAPPIRIILDRQGRMDPNLLRLFEPTSQGGPLWILTQIGHAQTPPLQYAQEHGAQIFEVQSDGLGLSLPDVLTILGEANITQLMVEAGGRLAGALLSQNLVQKLWLMLGNRILMDPAAKSAFVGGPIFHLDEAPTLDIVDTFRLGDTWVLEAYPLPARTSS